MLGTNSDTVHVSTHETVLYIHSDSLTLSESVRPVRDTETVYAYAHTWKFVRYGWV